jgi:hypothetical protein
MEAGMGGCDRSNVSCVRARADEPMTQRLPASFIVAIGHTKITKDSFDLTRIRQQRSPSAATAVRPGPIQSLHSRSGSNLQWLRMFAMLRLPFVKRSAEVGLVALVHKNKAGCTAAALSVHTLSGLPSSLLLACALEMNNFHCKAKELQQNGFHMWSGRCRCMSCCCLAVHGCLIFRLTCLTATAAVEVQQWHMNYGKTILRY